MTKIELTLTSIIITEGVFLLLFFQYSFLNIILGIIIGMLLILLTKKIKKNLFTSITIIIASAFLYIIFLYKIIFFINENILKNYSIIIITISLIIMSIYLSNNKYHTFIKMIEIIFYIILFIKISALILTLPLIKISNLIIDFSYSYHLIYVSLFILYLYKIFFYINNHYLKKKELIISFINPLLIKVISSLILGNPLSKLYKYPYVKYLQNIKYFNFIERMDGILSFEYILCFIMLISFCLLIIKEIIISLHRASLTRESLRSKIFFLISNINKN